MKIKVGDVVIVSTNQAGTVHSVYNNEVCVLLRCGDFWYGQEYDVRIPKNKGEFKSCVVTLDKWKKKT